MAVQSAPEVHGRVTDHDAIAAGFGTVDLTAISGKPAFAPQELYAHNAGAASQSLVCTCEDGAVLTLPIGIGETQRVIGPIASLAASGANVSVLCLWWNWIGAARN